jgi:hypothetical protein
MQGNTIQLTAKEKKDRILCKLIKVASKLYNQSAGDRKSFKMVPEISLPMMHVPCIVVSLSVQAGPVSE